MKATFFKFLLLSSLISLSFPLICVSADETIEPVEFDFILPGQDWSFLNISSLVVNKTADYNWVANQTLRGREVTETQYQTLLGMTLSERVAYFESLGFIESKFDSGRTDTGISGNLYFVFVNPETSAATIHFTITYLDNILQPWVIGIISSSVVFVILVVCVILIIRISRKLLASKQAEEEKSPAQKYLEM
jgi:hypothetical protein